MSVLEALAKQREYKRRIEEAKARERSRGRMPKVVAPPGFTHPERIERRFCEPDKVQVLQKEVTSEGQLHCELRCPGGATRDRTFSREECVCYYDALGKSKKPSACDKTEMALACADHLTPTLTECFTSGDVPRKEASKCLNKMLDKEEVSAENTWEKFREFPRQPPQITERELHDLRLGQYFAGEPLHALTPEGREKLEKEKGS